MKTNSSINSNTSRYIVDLPHKLLIHQYQLSLTKDNLDSLIDKLEILKQFKSKYGPEANSTYDAQNKMLVIHRPLNDKEINLAVINKLHVDIKYANRDLENIGQQNIEMSSKISSTRNEIQKYDQKINHATEEIKELNKKIKELEGKLSKNLPLNIFSWKQIVDYCKQTHEDDQKIKEEQDKIQNEVNRLTSIIKNPPQKHLLKNLESFKMHLTRQEEELQAKHSYFKDSFLSKKLAAIYQSQEKAAKSEPTIILPTEYRMPLEKIIKEHPEDLNACRDFLKQYPEDNLELNRLLGLK